ncbi:hypothetical protein C8D87_104185 [Lentzea atacamensis]|uniref:Helix-turn-helix domain-containing protein n=1 Tax=Lentzea atacamensis TaxID=531938 RepID=A0ABX9EAX1_9PSEU|nr:hypothetical protein [Lentzea atacamensis]RAS65635.1 hypothetical protein C8D87_104185 [Lentzea atacamensis]
MTNAVQTDQTNSYNDADRVLEILSNSTMGLRLEDIYRKLSGDVQYLSPQELPEFDPFGDNAPDPKLDSLRSLMDGHRDAGKVELNTLGRWQLVRTPFAPQKPVQPPKAAVPSPRAPQTVSAAQPPEKPFRSDKQTRKGEKHPGSATKNRPTRDDFTQNEHQMAVFMMDIGSVEGFMALRLATLAYGTDKYGGRGVFKAPIDTAADLCKMGRSTFSRNLVKLLDAGLFVRLDNAMGGRGNRNPMILKPSLPAWYKKGSEL